MTVILETERLFLRELLLNDVEPLSAILAKPDVTKHVGGPRAPAAVRQWIQTQQESYREHGYGYWAVVHRESAILIGQAGLNPDLGCELDEPYWRLGLGKEVVSAIVAHAFDHLKLHQVTAKVHEKNKPGAKLAEAIGMRVHEKGELLVYRIERDDQHYGS